MKKSIYIVFLSLFLLLPINVFANDLRCNASSIEYDQTFFCSLYGEAGYSYSNLSGNIVSTDDLVKCSVSTASQGLTKVDSLDGFYYKGTSNEDKLIDFSCKLDKKLSDDTNLQIKINNFIHSSSKNNNDILETLSTDFITAKKYVQKEEVDDLPRNTSNPDSLLKSLSEEHFNFVFSRFVTIYHQEVLYEVETINVNAIPNNELANVKILLNNEENNNKLNVGLNFLDVYVQSPDGTSITVYTVNVTRLARGESIYYEESDATLSSLLVPGYAISFNKDTYDYYVHLESDVNKLTVNANPTIESASVNITSTENLRNGSLIKISVTSKDKSNTLEYKIHITKEMEKKNMVPYYIGIGAVILLIFMVLLFIKTSNSKKKTNPKTDVNAIPDANPNWEFYNQGSNPQIQENNISVQNNEIEMPRMAANPNMNQIQNNNMVEMSVNNNQNISNLNQNNTGEIPNNNQISNQ